MLLCLLFACALRSTGPAGGGAPDAAAPPAPLALPGLRDVACGAGGCLALADGRLIPLDGGPGIGERAELGAMDTLRASGDAWELEGPCPATDAEATRCRWRLPAPLPTSGPLLEGLASERVPVATQPPDDPPLGFEASADAFVAAWNEGLPRGWRSGFARVIVGPGNGRLTWLRGIDGAGRLVRAGAGSRTARLGATPSPVAWPAWLAIHPAGIEAYLVPWPSSVVRAFDPATLEVRWTLPVEGPAQGLFVDPGGRWLLVGIGPAVTDRLLDWTIPRPMAGAEADPSRDELLRELERPTMDAVLVIDLASRAVVARARGSYRRFLALDRPVLATDREIVHIDPGDAP